MEKSVKRFAALGPYLCTFPRSFANETISRYSHPGDRILDPFCGRGTAIYAAATLGREGTGVDINPVAYCFAQAKTQPQGLSNVLGRLYEIKRVLSSLPDIQEESEDFFKQCFSSQVLGFLKCAREELKWQTNPLDCELMAFILHHLHGDRGSSLSNQMPRTRSLRKDYCLRYWRSKGYAPPSLDPFCFLEQKIRYRYKFGRPSLEISEIHLGDSRNILEAIESSSYDLVLTSPPYIGRTSYFDDQWLRLWALGIIRDEKHDCHGNFSNNFGYLKLLQKVFAECARILKPKGYLVIRTDVRGSTLEATKEVLSDIYPSHSMSCSFSDYQDFGLTERLGNTSNEKGEVDIVLSPKIVGRPKRRGSKKRLLTLSNYNYGFLEKESQESGQSISQTVESILSERYTGVRL